MAATKYVPKHFAGVVVGTTPTAVFVPGTGTPAPLEEILTGVVVTNGASAAREVSLYYMNSGNSIYLFNQLLLPSHSTSNLDLYLPLVAGQNLMASASNAGDISLTLYGLRLENI